MISCVTKRRVNKLNYVPIHLLGRKPVYVPNVLSGAVIGEFRFFKRKKIKKSQANVKKNHVYLNFIPRVIFSSIFAILLLFHMLMSLEVRTEGEN